MSAAEAEVTAAEFGQHFTLQGVDYLVSASCEENRGAWYCITHRTSFPNQLMKDSHIQRGVHQLAWVCLSHGPEVP